MCFKAHSLNVWLNISLLAHVSWAINRNHSLNVSSNISLLAHVSWNRGLLWIYYGLLWIYMCLCVCVQIFCWYSNTIIFNWNLYLKIKCSNFCACMCVFHMYTHYSFKIWKRIKFANSVYLTDIIQMTSQHFVSFRWVLSLIKTIWVSKGKYLEDCFYILIEIICTYSFILIQSILYCGICL